VYVVCKCISIVVLFVQFQDRGISYLLVVDIDSTRFWLGYAMHTSLCIKLASHTNVRV